MQTRQPGFVSGRDKTGIEVGTRRTFAKVRLAEAESEVGEAMLSNTGLSK